MKRPVLAPKVTVNIPKHGRDITRGVIQDSKTW